MDEDYFLYWTRSKNRKKRSKGGLKPLRWQRRKHTLTNEEEILVKLQFPVGNYIKIP